MTRGSEERYAGKYRHYDMEDIGYKCNMTDIQAAMLLPQLPRLEEYRLRKDQIARRYEQGLGGLPGIDLIRTPPNTKHARHLFTFLAPEGKRDDFILGLQQKEIGVAVHFNAVHLMSYYRNTFGFKEGDFPHAERICRRTITLPLYQKLTDEEADYVIGCVRELAVSA
jgi:dTDP-4-amino-4,6-dideoxygalactose transaminase